MPRHTDEKNDDIYLSHRAAIETVIIEINDLYTINLLSINKIQSSLNAKKWISSIIDL